MKVVIVGGVAGGASAATRLRRLDESAEIVMFERGPDVSFANCGLPYHIGGEIAERQKLLVVTPQLLRDRFRVDVRVESEVLAIDRQAQSITVRPSRGQPTYTESYDRLLLATGAAPIRPPLPGLDLLGIETLRNLGDTDRIKAAVDRGTRHVAMIGAGFIGLELVENFIRRGLAVTLIELQDQVLPPLDREMTTPVLAELKKHGVDVRLGEAASGFTASGEGIQIQLKSGGTLTAGLVVLGVGVRPENGLALAAGLTVGERGGIKVNERMQTSDPRIFAVGDVVEVTDHVTGQPTQVPLAGPANRQGRIAASNILGHAASYQTTLGTAIVRIFDLTAACTGASEKTLKRLGRPYAKVYTHPAHHATYFPGAQPFAFKLLFDPKTGDILGAQAVGGAGVDKRIDVMAVALKAKLRVADLEDLELAYSPQYGSAKDPINMIGFVAQGVITGTHPQISVDELLAGPPPAMVLDVRTPREFAAGALPGAVNIPIDELRGRLDAIPQTGRVVVYCQVGQRGYNATRLLLQAGRTALNLSGGYQSYRLFVPA